MPNIKSAIKRVKQTEKKTLRNKSVRTSVATAMKKFKVAINANDPATAEKLLPFAFKEIDSACADGVFHKNNAARKKAGLSKMLSDLKSGKLVIAVKIDNKTKIAAKKAREAAEKEAAKIARTEAQAKKAAAKAEAAKPVKKKAAKKVEAEEVPAEKPKKAKKAKDNADA